MITVNHRWVDGNDCVHLVPGHLLKNKGIDVPLSIEPDGLWWGPGHACDIHRKSTFMVVAVVDKDVLVLTHAGLGWINVANFADSQNWFEVIDHGEQRG